MITLAVAVSLITAEPERHHICQVAMAQQQSADTMFLYECQRQNNIVHILGDKTKPIDCSAVLPKRSPMTLTYSEAGKDQWSVKCTDKDMPAPPRRLK